MESQQIKFLVLGATGMAGHTISLYLSEKGYDVTAYSRSPFPYCRNIIGDARNETSFLNMINGREYDVIVNCIGLLNKDCDNEPALAVYLNSYIPHLITDHIKNSKTKMIQISTDCVFSGKTGNYKEKDFRDGETIYDRTKALGEIEDNKNLTFRNSIIGPDLNENGIGLFNWFMKQHGIIQGYNKAVWTGVTTLTLAKAIEQAAKQNLDGIYHLVNNANINKFELLCLFNKHFKKNQETIISNEKIIIDKSLINTRTDFLFDVLDYEQMIINMREWIFNHNDLYPHYFKLKG